MNDQDCQKKLTRASQENILITKAAILEQVNQPLRVANLKIPVLGPGQVLVDMKWSGLCRSQLMEMQGARGPDKYLPHLLGHEGAGVVKDIGASVSKVSPGDHVVITWIKGSGLEGGSTSYLEGSSSVSAGPVTTFSSYAVISENRCIPFDKSVPMDVASLLGCAVPTGAGIVINEIDLTPASSIAIWGVGGIGLCAIVGAVLTGCEQIVAIDITDEKLEMARSFGATNLVRADQKDFDDQLLSMTNGVGFDFAVEATGNVEVVERAFESVRDFGGLCIFASHPPVGHKISIEPHALIRGKQIRGSWGGSTNPDKDIPKFVDLYLSGRLPLDKLISHRFKLDQINQAFKQFNEGRGQRILLDLN